ncbi:response regulator [uncultured Caulobacter sp.]|uniref:response regulator n=1 Tax=uncultured Caulobacter sp. TaxID=158749 RepID=UPI002623EA83|nr:response regulator [uncultured Caulobacter sp.]
MTRPDRIWRLAADGRVIAQDVPDAGGAETSAQRVHWRELWRDENRASAERALERARTGRSVRFRTSERAADGTRIYRETLIAPIPGLPGELLAVSSDVTEAAEASALMTSVISALPSPLLAKSLRNNQVILWNPAAEAAFGLDAEEVLGRDIQEALGADLAQRLTPASDEQIRGGETRLNEAVAIPQAYGGGAFDIRSYLTFDDEGERHLVSMAIDAAERLRHEQELSQALQAAQAANTAKARFLTNMSHEVRTPLNGLVACADMLGRLELSAAGQEMVSIIRAASSTLHRLFADLLQVAEGEETRGSAARQPFQLGDLSRAVIGEAALAAPSNIKVDLDLASDLDAVVIGDERRLGRALTILLTNALKFTEEGEVRLSVEARADERVRFVVSDTGIGFSAAQKSAILERFTQADESSTRRFGGLGLGLSIARDLIQSMGGALDCDGSPGRGAAFWFDLALPRRDPAPARAADPAPRPAKILVVDDHEANRRIIDLMLAGQALTVGAVNGQEALVAYRAGPPDLILMDVQMPVMDGLTAVREIRRHEHDAGLPRCPVIMLTANVGEDHARRSAEAGADLHLEKPITAAALFEGIAVLLSA